MYFYIYETLNVTNCDTFVRRQELALPKNVVVHGSLSYLTFYYWLLRISISMESNWCM